MTDVVTTLHGTDANRLTARAVYQTAVSDMARKRRNIERSVQRNLRRQEFGNLPDAIRQQIGRDEPYGFVKAHVNKSENEKQLLEAALGESEKIRNKIKFWEYECSIRKEDDPMPDCPYKATTILLYQDDQRLADALAICK